MNQEIRTNPFVGIKYLFAGFSKGGHVPYESFRSLPEICIKEGNAVIKYIEHTLPDVNEVTSCTVIVIFGREHLITIQSALRTRPWQVSCPPSLIKTTSGRFLSAAFRACPELLEFEGSYGKYLWNELSADSNQVKVIVSKLLIFISTGNF
jgi:hypothetical protein